MPIVLRPSPSGNFQLVGDSYVHGLCDTEALLGSLPKLWSVELYSDGNANRWPVFVNNETNFYTGHDPRLGALPDRWEGIPLTSMMDKMPPLSEPIFQTFTCTRTGEISDFDPRLSREALEKRGVMLQMFKLI